MSDTLSPNSAVAADVPPIESQYKSELSAIRCIQRYGIQYNSQFTCTCKCDARWMYQQARELFPQPPHPSSNSPVSSTSTTQLLTEHTLQQLLQLGVTAHTLYLASAHHGYPRAQCHIARILRDSQSIAAFPVAFQPNASLQNDKDAVDDVAFQWFVTTAVNAKYPPGMYELAVCIERKCTSRTGALTGEEEPLQCQRVDALLRRDTVGEDGLGVLSEAFLWYKRSAEGGYRRAQFVVGVWYAGGRGGIVEKDEAAAFAWWLKSAENGSARGQFNVGVCYWNGTGTEMNAENALKWWKRAARRNDAGALFQLGLIYERGEHVARAMNVAADYFKKSAQLGHRDAHYRLARFYETGHGVVSDLDRAKHHFQCAASAGHLKAAFRLSFLLRNSAGSYPAFDATSGSIIAQTVPDRELSCDKVESVKWMLAAAHGGYGPALLEVGVCMQRGVYGFVKDEVVGKEWIELAAMTGVRHAQYMLGLCFGKGIGTEQNCALACEWWLKAAHAGCARSQCALGILYLHLEEGDRCAYMWLTKSAQQGDGNARKILAENPSLSEDSSNVSVLLRKLLLSAHIPFVNPARNALHVLGTPTALFWNNNVRRSNASAP